MLEFILFDLKSAHRFNAENKSELPIHPLKAKSELLTSTDEAKGNETDVTKDIPDIKARIKNAATAIKNLGGETVKIELDKMSDAELESEFEELTNQYKRLKKTKESVKK